MFFSGGTIKHLLRLLLQEAVKLAGKKLGISGMAADEVELEKIPLRSLPGQRQLIYVSAIAIKLSSFWHRPAIDIANEISLHLFVSDRAEQISAVLALQNFTVKVVSSGSIYLELNDPGMAAWLQCYAQAPAWPTLPSDTQCLNPKLFYAQYTHARCCSLLRLGDREGIITLKQLDPNQSPPWFEVSSPNPIPWLDSSQKLRLVDVAERNLVFHVLTLPDGFQDPIAPNQAIYWQKSAMTLSEAFQLFYSQCRIWGEVKTQTPQLAQARLGLVMATQALLHLLLQNLLGVAAPLDL
jgi:DALR anticodon binding domain